MEKAQQKQTMGNDFWADVQKGLITFIIIGTGLLVSIWLGVYIAGLK